MTVHFWIGQDFDTTHERIALAELLRMMQAQLGPHTVPYHVLANYTIGGSQIDVTVLKQDAIIIIDLKEFSEPFRATENGPWRTLDRRHIVGSSGENPFEQVNRYRGHWKRFLDQHLIEIVTEAKAKYINVTHVSGYVCISPSIPNGTRNEVDRAAVWFRLISLRDVILAVTQATSEQLNFNDKELNKIIKLLNLRPGDASLGGTIQVPSGYVTRGGSAPSVPSLLIGRDDALSELKKRIGLPAISPSGNGQRPVQILTAVRGWPGVGKTTLAAAIAHAPEVSRHFSDGVLWASLGDSPNLISELASWCQAVGMDHLAESRDLEHMRSQLTAHMRDKKMLLIVDDVWNAKHVVPFQVGGPNCRVLITTRASDIAEELAAYPGDVYKLDVLADDAALALLARLAPSVFKTHPDQCKELVQRLEGLPLAIQVAGRLLHAESRYGWGIDELLDELSKVTKILETPAPADRSDIANQTTPTVAALLKQSTDRLDEDTRLYFAFLGHFAPQPATFDEAAIAKVCGVTDAKPIIRTLVDRGLLEPFGGRYQMHALLAAHANYLLEMEDADE